MSILDKLEQSKVFRNDRREVRAIMYHGKTYFSLNDILTACGTMAPGKWIARAKERQCNIEAKRLLYPKMTKKGLQEYSMWFVDSENAKVVLRLVYCPDDIKDWLNEEVLTYRFESEEQPEIAPEENYDLLEEENKGEEENREEEKYLEVPEPAKVANRTLDLSAEKHSLDVVDLNRRIDMILIELLEIKKMLIQTNPA